MIDIRAAARALGGDVVGRDAAASAMPVDPRGTPAAPGPPRTGCQGWQATGIQRIALTPEGRKLRSLGGPRDLAQDKAILSCVATGSTLCSEPPRLPNLQRYHRVV